MSGLARLTHIDEAGRARMVDVSDKPVTAREAVAAGLVRMDPATLALALGGGGKKGDVRAVAEIAGVMAAKKTAELIPLCHPLSLTKVVVEVGRGRRRRRPGGHRAGRAPRGQTGVEMEALTAVSVACLTIYDMLKAADKAMTIEAVRLVEKTGGASGDFRRRGAMKDLPVEEARARILAGVAAPPAETVAAGGRPSAGCWPRTVTRDARPAAVRRLGHGRLGGRPAPGERFAHRRRKRGRPRLSPARWPPGQAVRIFTGAAGPGRARHGW